LANAAAATARFRAVRAETRGASHRSNKGVEGVGDRAQASRLRVWQCATVARQEVGAARLDR
jgi:hypothetical protein